MFASIQVVLMFLMFLSFYVPLWIMSLKSLYLSGSDGRDTKCAVYRRKMYAYHMSTVNKSLSSFFFIYRVRFVISILGPVGIVLGVGKFTYHSIVAGFRQFLHMCCCLPNSCNDTIFQKSEKLVPHDICEAIRTKQFKTSAFLRASMQMQGRLLY